MRLAIVSIVSTFQRLTPEDYTEFSSERYSSTNMATFPISFAELAVGFHLIGVTCNVGFEFKCGGGVRWRYDNTRGRTRDAVGFEQMSNKLT